MLSGSSLQTNTLCGNAMSPAKCLLALLYGAQVIGQLHAAPSGRNLFYVDETTVAVQVRNASNSIERNQAPTRTTYMTTVATMLMNKSTTKDAADSKTRVLKDLTTEATSAVTTSSVGSRQGIGERYYETTTAIPPYVGPVPTYRQFDALSFIGGALVTICLITIGTMLWKMYMAHVERRHWTL